MRLVMQRAALQETARLAADDAWARVWLYWPTWLWSWARFFWPAAYHQSVRGTQPSVTRGAFQINRRVCAPLRLTWASADYGVVPDPQKWRRRYAWRRPGSRLGWNGLDVPTIRRRLRIAPWVGSRHDWHTHYNTACVYAVAMNAHRRDRLRQRRLARYVVAHLDQAIHATSGRSAAVERSWMVDEDPDLALLRRKGTRANALFNNFVRTVYPSADAFEQSPPSSRSDEQLREYDYRLLEEIAKVMQQVWNQRSETADVDIQHATEWLRTERKIWNSLHGISADESKRRWQDRVTLIRFIQANYQPMSSSSPGFPPPLVPDEPASPNGLPEPREIEKTLAELHHDMAKARAYAMSNAGQRLLRERAADGVTRLDTRTVQRLSTGYAAAWQTLDDWLEGEAEHTAFRHALRDVPRLTRRRVTALRDGKRLRI